MSDRLVELFSGTWVNPRYISVVRDVGDLDDERPQAHVFVGPTNEHGNETIYTVMGETAAEVAARLNGVVRP